MTNDFNPKRILINNYIHQIKLLNDGELPVEFMQKAEPSPAAQQSPAVELPKEAEMLLRLYGEFANTDDGKALAAGLGKFARFVQSEVDRAKPKAQ